MRLVAWDFDGVLNQGYAGGFEQWQREFEADLGASAAVFAEHMFGGGRFDAVLTGQRDILDLLAEWVAVAAVPHTAEAVLDYWLQKDAQLDPQVMGWLSRCATPGVIATNNDARRADFIWNRLGFAARLQRIFASGPMGVRKPEAGFFAAIETWSGLAAQDILLIDDTEKNIAAAATRGWQVFHFHADSRNALPEVLGVAP